MKSVAMFLAVAIGAVLTAVSPAADFDGDGTQDIGIFRPSSGLWAVRLVTRLYFGGSADAPVPGDYNGDRRDEIAIFRRGSGLWAVRGLTRAYFGSSSDIPLGPGWLPHDHVGEVWSANIAWSNGAFKVLNYSNGPSVWGWNGGGGNGLRGYATGAGIGVYGESQDNTGIMGRSTTGDGVSASGCDDGLFASRKGDLMLDGSYGDIYTPGFLRLWSDQDVYVTLDANDDGFNSFVIYNGSGTPVVNFNENGDFTAAGTKSAIVETADYGRRLLYALESPEVWLEDIGTAVLADGEAAVAFEPVFAQTINREAPYHVFVTPLSPEPVILFITSKTSDGFTVRGITPDNRAASCSFDYRVVARRLGYEEVRLEPSAGVALARVDHR